MKVEQFGLLGESKITTIKPKKVKAKTLIYSFKYQSLGAGLQSSTITEMIVEGELPLVDMVIFADTGNEPDYTYEQVEYLRGRLSTISVPLLIVSIGNIIDNIYSNGRKASIPLFTKLSEFIGDTNGIEVYNSSIGRLRRQCTREYKIAPIEKLVRHELLARNMAKVNKAGSISINNGVTVQCQLGISFDEIQRMKPNPSRWIDNSWPLIDRRMNRKGCEDWLKTRGLPVPKKSSCKICPYHTPKYFRDMRDYHPSDFDSVIQFDNDLRNGAIYLPVMLRGELYMNKDCIPLSEVDLESEQEKGQLDMCDEGYCFI